MAPYNAPFSASPRVTLAERSLDNKYGTQMCWEAIFPILGTLIVLGRVLLRRKYGIKIGLDDWSIAAAIPFAWGTWLAFFAIYRYATPDTIATIPPQNIPILLKWIFVNIQVSVMAISFIKISILCFYLRAFGTTRQARIWIYVLLAINIAYGGVRFFFTIFACMPTSDFWNNPANCKSNQFVYWVTISIVGLVTEVAILLFPLPFIWKLHVSAGRKLAILAVFCLGIAVLVPVILRIYYFETVVSFAQFIFTDQLACRLQLMQEIETFLGVLVACLPAMYNPLQTLFASWIDRMRGKENKAATGATPSISSPLRRSKRSGGLTTTDFSTIATTMSEKDADPTVVESKV